MVVNELYRALRDLQHGLVDAVLEAGRETETAYPLTGGDFSDESEMFFEQTFVELALPVFNREQERINQLLGKSGQNTNQEKQS